MSETAFDVIVIGSGPGGYVSAIRAAQLGLKTACVEYEKTLGGTCLNVGCIPSKALLQSSEHYHHAVHDLKKHGVIASQVSLDLPTMLKRKDEVVKGLTTGVAGLLKKNKVTWLKGRGSFVNPTTIKVTDEAGQSTTYSTRHVVIATGSKPIEIPPAKYDRETIVSSTGALKFDKVPGHLLVVGGGVIGLEMGSVWLRLGAKVTVIEAADRCLGTMDEDLGNGLMKVLQKQGMEFHLSTKLTGTKVSVGKVTATCVKADGSTVELTGDKMLVAVGRRPFTEGLGLDAIGLALEAGGRVPVNEHLQTPVAGVWAIGDVVRGPMLAHKSEEEGIAVAELIAGKAGHVTYDAIPNVVYTWPEVASVGLSEAEAKAKGLAVNVGKFPFLANGRAKALGNTDGFVKIVADAKTDRLLGAQILGPSGSELIAELALAMEFGASAEDVARTCHAHPTLSEAVKEAALGVDKRTIHF
jgi:dihydrolipoamide dehydrogenase